MPLLPLYILQLGASKEDGLNRSSSFVHNEDIMQTLLVHEPKAGSSRIPGQESSDESDKEVSHHEAVGGEHDVRMLICA
jgi:hypothetical protein